MVLDKSGPEIQVLSLMSWLGVIRMLFVTRGCLRSGHVFRGGCCKCGRQLVEWRE